MFKVGISILLLFTCFLVPESETTEKVSNFLSRSHKLGSKDADRYKWLVSDLELNSASEKMILRAELVSCVSFPRKKRRMKEKNIILYP